MPQSTGLPESVSFVKALRKRTVKELADGLRWRRENASYAIRKKFGLPTIQWMRVVMQKATTEFLSSLPVQDLSALEISGRHWAHLPFRSYQSVDYPEYDICSGPHKENFYDVVIAEQVLEHVLWPYRAVRNVHRMLKPEGVFIVNTPFLVRVHNHPVDCSRWTELGIKHLLAEGSFELKNIQTGSWGNRRCAISNFARWIPWTPVKHSLRNEPDFPCVVWAFARK